MTNAAADKNRYGSTPLTTYRCAECGFHYRDKATAEKCGRWCRAHRSCNIEITKEAVENETRRQE